jgi:uncharacterized protein (TIRG00374 family)
VLGRGARRPLVAAAGFLVSAGFAYLAVRHVDWGRFRDGIASSNPWWLLPALAVLAAGVALRALRWRLLFAPETRPPLAAVARALLVGTFFNNVLPGRAGEAIRVVYLHDEAATSRVEALGTAVTERVYDVAGLLVILFALTPWLPETSWARRAAVVAAVLAAAMAVGIAVLARWQEGSLRALLRPFVRLPSISAEHVERAATNLFAGLVAFRRGRVAVPAFALTLLAIFVIGLSFWLTTLALRLHVSLAAALLVMVATNLAMVIPSSPAAVGVFEAATLAALHPFGIDKSRALSYAVVLHGLNVVPFVLAGVLLVQRHALHMARRPPLEPGAEPVEVGRAAAPGEEP